MALVYIDIGQASPWNLISNNTLVSSLDSNSQLYEALAGTGGFVNQTINVTADATTAGMNLGDPAQIMVEYTCRFQEPKPAAQIIVSTAVATLTLFNNGWAVMMLVFAYFARRKHHKGNVRLFGVIQTALTTPTNTVPDDRSSEDLESQPLRQNEDRSIDTDKETETSSL